MVPHIRHAVQKPHYLLKIQYFFDIFFCPVVLYILICNRSIGLYYNVRKLFLPHVQNVIAHTKYNYTMH